MATERVTAASRSLELQAVQEQGLHQPRIKTEEDGDERVKGSRAIRAGILRNILGWAAPDQVKEELDEGVPPCWERRTRERLKSVPSPYSRWGSLQQQEEALWERAKRQEQQVPVLFDETDSNSPEAEPLLVDGRRHLPRDVKRGLEAVSPAVPIHRFPKTSRRGTNWSQAEVMDLLEIWGEQKIQQVLQSSHRNMDTFQVIANQMARRGHERTAQECRTKTKTLRREYKKVKEDSQAGKGDAVCPFYDQLERILDSKIQPPGRVRNFAYPEELGGYEAPQGVPEERLPHEESEGYLETQDFFNPPNQLPTELVALMDSASVVCKRENTFEEEPIGTPRRAVEASHLPRSLPPAPHSIPGSPATTGSTADAHLSPPHSPSPSPAGLSAAQRLSSLRNRHKKTRNDSAAELARAADRRMQAATDRILSVLNGYARADLEDREKDRAGTEQIIAIMNRQTELLELLVQQQASGPVAGSPPPSRHMWTPWIGQLSHRPAGPSPSRLGVPRRPLTSRARPRRRPQNYSA